MATLRKQMKNIFPILLIISGLMLLYTSFCQAAGKQPRMVWPVEGTITSEYGWRTHPIWGTQKYHSGLDIGVDYGTPVKAAAAGAVCYSGWISGYGNTIIINHGGGITTLYAHNDALRAAEGQQVGQGQIIALAGSTGNSTGPHCHFEVRENDTPVSPYGYLDGTMEGYEGEGSFFQSDYNFLPMDFTAANDIAKPLREESDALINACLKAMKILQEKLKPLMITLMTIDFAVAAMWQMFKTYYNPNKGGAQGHLSGYFYWLIKRALFYGMLIYIFDHWQEYFVNVIMDLFAGLGGMAANMTPGQTGKLMSDPTDMIQHGVSLLGPIFNKMGSTPIHLLFNNPIDFFLVLALGILMIIGLLFIGAEISMAYIEFYFTAIFAFTLFCFNSIEQLRTYGGKSVNAVIICGIQILFYSIFVAILSAMLKHLSVNVISGDDIQITVMLGMFCLELLFILYCRRMHKVILTCFNVAQGFRFRTFSQENALHI